MIVAIPSKGRAGVTSTDKILPSSVFYVPENEVHQYEKVVANVVGVPNSVKGITPTRNWILKNCRDNRVVMIDDDVQTCGYTHLLDRNGKQVRIIDEETWLDHFERWFDICDGIGYKIWGLKSEAALRSTYPYRPFIFHTYITASCMGIVNDGEYYFDEQFVVKEDYEIGLRHLMDKGGVLGVRYMHWQNEHWDKAGGCKDYRTVQIEQDAILKLVDMYPGFIRRAKRKDSKFTIELNF